MKALVKLKAEEGIWLTDVPVPTMGPSDVLIKIKKTSLCGTDTHIYNWDEWAQKTVPVPLVTGHEFVGEIVEMGKDVKNFKIHDMVSGENHIVCGVCRHCRAGRRHYCHQRESAGITRAGCFAEYLVIPAENAYLIPNIISEDVAAILNPFGNATHCALSFGLVGEDVLITGAGPVGIMAVAVARHVGARHIVITDVNEYRLDLAKKMGASIALNVKHSNLKSAMDTLGMREGFDIGLEMSGNPQAFNDMLLHMNHAGKIAMLGFLPKETQIDWDHIIMKGLIVKGIYGREMYDTWYKMVSMLQSGLNIAPVITHHYSVDEYQKAFDIMRSGSSGKVILQWN
jgi:threonine 3-dehydrogenase